MNQKYKYLGKNTIVFAISSFGTKILSFLLVPLYTSVLTTDEYGTVDLITTTSTLLVFILTINIASSVLRFALDNQEYAENILSFGFRVLNIGTVLCGIVISIVYMIQINGWPLYYYAFIVLYFYASALYEIMTNYLRAIDKVREVAVAGVLSSLFIILGNIFFLLIVKVGLAGYILSIVIGPLLSSVYCIMIANVSIKTYFLINCNKKTQEEMVRYCIPLIFNNIALWINAFLDRYFVTYYCGIAENGIYSVAGKIPMILSTFYSVFANAWTLSAIIEFNKDDSDGFFSKTYNTYSAFMTMLCSMIILFNIPLAHFLYSKNFFVAWQYSSVLLLSVMFNTLTSFQGSIFTAAKKTQSIATTTIISAFANTILNIILIPIIGALGAAISTAIAYFVLWVVRYKLARKFIKMKINIKRDILIFSIVSLQIVFEHTKDHFYIGQILCFICIIFINKKYITSIIKVLMRKIF